MALKESEAIVLRTYPLRESDLLVTLFTRMEGKVKGVARAAMKSRRRFGGALEPLTYVRVFYDDRERQELARLDSCEVIESPMSGEVGYPRAVALAHVGELLDELMPDREASDAVFRLSLAVLQELRGPVLWMPLTYFELWMTRLLGFLAALSSESRNIAAQMLRSRVSEFSGIDWPKAVCADLRKFLLQILERHIEKKLVTAGMLEKIGS